MQRRTFATEFGHVDLTCFTNVRTELTVFDGSSDFGSKNLVVQMIW